MKQHKMDGIIEAVRYAPDGKISLARIYERRGVVWSDHFLVSRRELVDRLQSGKHIAVGTRDEYLGSTFQVGEHVDLLNGHIITPGESISRDRLGGVGIF